MRFKPLLFNLPAAVFSFTILYSCDLITEPERIMNKNAKPIQERSFGIRNFSPGQHIDGTVYMEINTDSIDFEISSIHVTADNKIGTIFTHPPYIYELNTRDHNEGPHQVEVDIYQKNKVHGVLNVLYPPSIVMKNDFYFDRTPPEKVILSLTKSDDGYAAMLNWTEPANQNFVAYRVQRSYRHHEWYKVWEIIDTIYQKNQTTFTDSGLEKIYGAEIRYMVELGTNNSFEYPFSKSSDEKYINYGKTLDYPNFQLPLNDIVLNNIAHEVYFIGGTKLVAFSTINHALVKEMAISASSGSYYQQHFTLSTDGRRIFILNPPENTIEVIDAEAFSNIKTMELPFISSFGNNENNIVDLGGNRVLLVTHDNYLRIINIESGAVLDSASVPFATYFYSSAVTDDRSALVICQGPSETAPKIVVRDLLSPGLNIIREKVVSNYYSKIKISHDNQKIYALNGNIHIIDFTSLEIISSIDSSFYSFDLNGEKLYACGYKNIEHGEITIPASEIICFNTNSLQPEKNWFIFPGSSEIAAGSDYIYIHHWDINTAGIAVPIND